MRIDADVVATVHALAGCVSPAALKALAALYFVNYGSHSNRETDEQDEQATQDASSLDNPHFNLPRPRRADSFQSHLVRIIVMLHEVRPVEQFA